MLERSIIEQVWRTAEPELAELGYELVEVELGRMGATRVLRFFLDKEGGITIDDCAAASQVLSPVLDAHDLIEGNYMLEVSSPGIDRPIRKPQDFERFTGERVKVSTVTAIEGRKNFRGMLVGYEDGMVTVECSGNPYAIHLENIKKANLDR